eukprot:scaffold39140_cov176-Amphora_coffeaeformis.AAC.3
MVETLHMETELQQDRIFMIELVYDRVAQKVEVETWTEIISGFEDMSQMSLLVGFQSHKSFREQNEK